MDIKPKEPATADETIMIEGVQKDPPQRYSAGIPRITTRTSAEASKLANNSPTKPYGEEVLYKSKEQELALRLVLEGSYPLLAILPTGDGESLLFEGPATIHGAKVTVVKVPLVALRADLQKRAQLHGVDSQEWIEGRVHHHAPLIFVTA